MDIEYKISGFERGTDFCVGIHFSFSSIFMYVILFRPLEGLLLTHSGSSLHGFTESVSSRKAIRGFLNEIQEFGCC